MSSPTTDLIRTGKITFDAVGGAQYGMYNQKQEDVAAVKEKAKKAGLQVFETHILSKDNAVSKIVFTTFDPSLR